MKLLFRTIRLRLPFLAAALCLILFTFCGGTPLIVSSIPSLTEQKAEDSRDVLILMYHSILKDKKQTGDYVVTPEELEGDLQWLQKEGYTTVTLRDLIAYVYDGKTLPAKPVVLTFDDGYLNNDLYASPLLERYDSKAVIMAVGEYSERFSNEPDENPYYAHLTWDHLRAMQQSGRWEIGNHSYDMHQLNNNGRRGSLRKKKESFDAYRQVFRADTLRAQELLIKNSGYIPLAYAYPFGSIDKDGDKLLREMGFLASLSCTEGMNHLTRDPNKLFSLKRYRRPGGMDSKSFFKKIGI